MNFIMLRLIFHLYKTWNIISLKTNTTKDAYLLTLVQAAYRFRVEGGGGHIVPADLYMRYRGPNKWFIGFLKF